MSRAKLTFFLLSLNNSSLFRPGGSDRGFDRRSVNFTRVKEEDHVCLGLLARTVARSLQILTLKNTVHRSCRTKLDDCPPWDIQVQYEPVLIFLCFPLVVHRPNFEAREQLLEKLDRLLLGPRVSEAGEAWFRSRLRQLLGETRELLAL